MRAAGAGRSAASAAPWRRPCRRLCGRAGCSRLATSASLGCACFAASASRRTGFTGSAGRVLASPAAPPAGLASMASRAGLDRLRRLCRRCPGRVVVASASHKRDARAERDHCEQAS